MPGFRPFAVCLWMAACCAAGGMAPMAAADTRPNVVLLLVDDLGWNGMGNENNTEVITPRVAGLLKSSVRLTRHHTFKFCSPTRAALMTGRVPGHGIWQQNPSKTEELAVNTNMTMLPLKLQQAGYSTHQIGKWHLGFYSQRVTPHGRGFNTSFGFLAGGEDHFTQCSSCANSIPAPDWANHSIVCPAHYSPCSVSCPQQGGVDLFDTAAPALGMNGTNNAITFGNRAVEVIQQHGAAGNAPFFLYLASTMSTSRSSYIAKYPATDYNSTTVSRRIYNAMHSAVASPPTMKDDVIGRTYDALEATKGSRDYVLVISSDNGGTFEHGMPVPGSSNYPLRGHKYSFFSGGIQVFSMVRSTLLPAHLEGTTNDGLMAVWDWYPTVCKLAGVDPRDGFSSTAPYDGVDVWPMLLNGSSTRPAVWWPGGMQGDEMMHGVGAVGALSQGSFKLIVGAQASKTDGWSAQYPGRTQWIPPPAKPACDPYCLFDLAADPREMHDLSTSQQAKAQAMLARYRELSTTMDVSNDGSRAGKRAGTANANAACAQMLRTGFWAPWVE